VSRSRNMPPNPWFRSLALSVLILNAFELVPNISVFPFSKWKKFNMYNDLPDVLMGDVFANAALFDNAPDLASEEIKQEDEFITEEKEMFHKQAPKTSSELISGLSDNARFFLLNCVDRTSASSSSSTAFSSSPVTCDACGLLLKKATTFIRCAECLDPAIDICVYCFSNGAEFLSHKANHPYIVLNSRNNNFTRNRVINKLNLGHILNFMLSVEQRGCFNYAELEKILGVPGGEAERVYLDIVRMLTRVAEAIPEVQTDQHVASTSSDSLEGGPANFNVLRDEFEHEYIPEAETLLAAVSPVTDENVPRELVSLFDGYNGILDERERRRKVLKAAGLVNLKDYYSALKKRKTDEKDMLEKTKIFTRALIEGQHDGGGCLAWLENFSSALTQRKRFIDRIKRLVLLKKNGIGSEIGQGNQFDTDRKKRNDVNSRKAAGPNVKAWTCMPTERPVVAPIVTARSARSSPSSPQEVTSPISKTMTATQAVCQLIGGDTISKSPELMNLCLDFHLAPQHLLVVEKGVHALLRSRGLGMSDEILAKVINDGMFGTIRRYLLAAQGLPVSVNPQMSGISIEDMKSRVIAVCRSTFNHR
jgi:hypothetical protein